MAESEEKLESLDECQRGESKKLPNNSTFKNEDHSILSIHFIVNTWGNSGNSDRFYFLGLQNHCIW